MTSDIFKLKVYLFLGTYFQLKSWNLKEAMAKDTFQERIKEMVNLAGNIADLSRLTGISPRSISGYINDESDPSRKKLLAIASAMKVSAGWLIAGVGPMREGDQVELPMKRDLSSTTGIPQWQHPDPEMYSYVPMAEAQLSAGGGMFVLSEEIAAYYAFRKDWLNRIATSSKNVVLMTVNGNSMHPTIQNKDTVLIDTGRQNILEGLLYAIRLDSTIMIKRLTHRPGDIINVVSDNKDEFETYQAKRSEIHVIGQIIHFSRDLANS
jgi:phage repressor protein C with HTH and peptisase S24 domain